jgi:hypothetical protein
VDELGDGDERCGAPEAASAGDERVMRGIDLGVEGLRPGRWTAAAEGGAADVREPAEGPGELHELGEPSQLTALPELAFDRLPGAPDKTRSPRASSANLAALVTPATRASNT